MWAVAPLVLGICCLSLVPLSLAFKEHLSSSASLLRGLSAHQTPVRISSFHDPFTGGGMSKTEQQFLQETYEAAQSVFEWGMGSSSVLANFVGVKKLVSIDSAKEWVDKTRADVNNDQYKFQYVDIGPVGAWGYPSGSPNDSWLAYAQKVLEETTPFDVYLVDGRFRIACACMALMHGRPDSFVMIHDFQRDYYQDILKVSKKIEQVGKLVKLQRNADRDSIMEMYNKHKFDLK